MGDYVTFQVPADLSQERPVIYERLPRRSVLTRADRYHPCKEIAANLTQVLVVLAYLPKTNEFYLDQYLAAAELAGLPASIGFNKIDLMPEPKALPEFLSYYQGLGYQVLPFSVQLQKHLEPLLALLKQEATLLLGTSGVGKSSLLNLLMDNPQAARVAAISTANQKGQHTTSTCTLYHLPFGGELFDAPGIRDLQLPEAQKPHLIQGFREFKPYLGQCQFRNCQHGNDNGCALQEALQRGDISPSRFKNYLRMV